MKDETTYPLAWGMIISGLLMAIAMGCYLWLA